jgi:type IV pilus assembly protein PilC
VLSEETENKKLRKIIGEIKSEVETGKQLSEALAKYPKIFPPIYVSMIASGEASGKLEESLVQVSAQMKKSHELTSAIRGAMIYPAVVFTAMIGIALEMVIFVLPKIMVMFNDFDAELPLATRILIGTINFLENYGLIVLVVLVALVITAIWLLRKPEIKKRVHKFNLHLPIFGAIIKKINLARFSLTLSSLLESTIPIIEAVKITSSVQSNVTYRDNLLVVAEALKKGENLSAVLRNYDITFPPMVTEMIMVGEQSGQVEKMLSELAEYYANEVDSTMKNFSTIIEPVVIVVLGLMVAGIAVAVIMPMYSLAQNF